MELSREQVVNHNGGSRRDSRHGVAVNGLTGRAACILPRVVLLQRNS